MGNPKTKKESVTRELCDRIVENWNIVRDNESKRLFFYDKRYGVYKHGTDDFISYVINQELPGFTVKSSHITCARINITIIMESNIDRNVDMDLDLKNFYINGKNGIYLLKENKLVPHSPEYYSTYQISANLPETPEQISNILIDKQDCLFARFLKTFSNHNKEVREVLMMFVGLIFTNIPGYKIKSGLFLKSTEGNTGKTVFKNTITAIVGKDNVACVDLKTLETRWGTGMCYGKRVIGSGDQSSAFVTELSNFKQMTGGDQIQAEHKGQNAFFYTFKGVFLCCANKLPTFSGDQGKYMYERFWIYEPSHSVPPKDRDDTLQDKIIEQDVDYIVALAILCVKKLIENNMHIPTVECLKKSRDKYKLENNSFASFCYECVVNLPLTKTSDISRQAIQPGTLMDAYLGYCQKSNIPFNQRLTRKECFTYLNKFGYGEKIKYHGYMYLKYVTIEKEVLEYYYLDACKKEIVPNVLPNYPDTWGTDINLNWEEK